MTQLIAPELLKFLEYKKTMYKYILTWHYKLLNNSQRKSNINHTYIFQEDGIDAWGDMSMIGLYNILRQDFSL